MSTGAPRSVHDISPAWLTGALRASGAIRTSAVTAVAVEAIGVGVGFLGQLARVRPTYDRPEQQAWRLWATGLAQASTGQVDKARVTLREMSGYVKKAEGVKQPLSSWELGPDQLRKSWRSAT